MPIDLSIADIHPTPAATGRIPLQRAATFLNTGEEDIKSLGSSFDNIGAFSLSDRDPRIQSYLRILDFGVAFSAGKLSLGDNNISNSATAPVVPYCPVEIPARVLYSTAVKGRAPLPVVQAISRDETPCVPYLPQQRETAPDSYPPERVLAASSTSTEVSAPASTGVRAGRESVTPDSCGANTSVSSLGPTLNAAAKDVCVFVPPPAEQHPPPSTLLPQSPTPTNLWTQEPGFWGNIYDAPTNSSLSGEQEENAMEIDMFEPSTYERGYPLQRQERLYFGGCGDKMLGGSVEEGAASASARQGDRLWPIGLTPTKFTPGKLLRGGKIKVLKSKKNLPEEHCQVGSLYIPYQSYEKVTLPDGKKGYHVPIGCNMKQYYKPRRRITVTALALASFKGSKSENADAYTAKREDGERVYADGIYVEESNTTEQELDECDKNDKGRDNVTLTVRPNLFVTAVLGEEVKDVLVDCVSFGTTMTVTRNSVRSEQIWNRTLSDMLEDQEKGKKKPLEEVEVVWSEEEEEEEEEEERSKKRQKLGGILKVGNIKTEDSEQRPAKKLKFCGVLKVLNIKTKEETLDWMVVDEPRDYFIS